MKKIAPLFVSLLLTALSLSSFAGPNPAGDSSRLVPAENIQRAVELFAELDDCKEERDSLAAIVITEGDALDACQETKARQRDEIKSLLAVASSDALIITGLSAELRSARRSKRWTAVLCVILGAGLILK